MIASHLICVIKQLFYDKKSCLREKNDISEKWDLRPETFGETQDPRPETRDPSCGWDPGPETHEPKGGTRRTETRNPTQRWDLGPKIRNPKGGTWDQGHLFYMGPKTWDPGQWKRNLGHLW